MNVLKNILPLDYYAIFATTENSVFYYMTYKGSSQKWIESDYIKDCEKMVVFKSLADAKKTIKYLKKQKEIPDICDAIEILKIVPTYNETGGYWFDELSSKREELK